MRKIVIAGDSHSDAVKRALTLIKQTLSSDVSVYRLSKIKDGQPFGDIPLHDVSSIAKTMLEDDIVVSMIGGNQHQILGLVQHPRPFDFFMPGSDLPVDQSCEIIPYHAVRDIFAAGLRSGDGVKLRTLREAATCRMVHMTPPPPKEDAEHILRRFESHFAKAGLSERGVSTPTLRLKLWIVQVDVLKDLCTELGVELLPPPPGTLTDLGFLEPKYYANDATHANTDYGLMILRQLDSLGYPLGIAL